MAEYFWGRIEVGGDLRQADVTRFCLAAGIDESDLPDHNENGRFALDDCEARYGQFEELEELCRELGLAYRRRSDGKYEFSPAIVFWQAGMEGAYGVITDHDGNMQVSMDEVRAIRDALRAGDVPNACFLADRVVVHLPTVPPFRLTRPRCPPGDS